MFPFFLYSATSSFVTAATAYPLGVTLVAVFATEPVANPHLSSESSNTKAEPELLTEFFNGVIIQND